MSIPFVSAPSQPAVAPATCGLRRLQYTCHGAGPKLQLPFLGHAFHVDGDKCIGGTRTLTFESAPVALPRPPPLRRVEYSRERTQAHCLLLGDCDSEDTLEVAQATFTGIVN